MSNTVFQFGLNHPDYPVRVLNERAVRAGAGILFFAGLVAFMNAWLVGNYAPTRLFVLVFLIDFGLRIFVNPQYSPSLIIGQWAIRKQSPEYVGAPQKRFAWVIGFVLALVMSYRMVLNHSVGPINLLICSVCLTLMFFEAAFGICIGCKLYNALNKDKAQLCPGGVCQTPAVAVPSLALGQAIVLLVFAGLTVTLAQFVYRAGANPGGSAGASLATPAPDSTLSGAAAGQPKDPAEIERCKVPEFAKAMGHEAKWKLHNNCP
jgi:hypothetical protein